MKTRICKLKNRPGGLICGQDLGDVFEEGIVYGFQNILGTIIVTPLGKSPDVNWDGDSYTGHSLNDIAIDGNYLNPITNLSRMSVPLENLPSED